MNLEGLVLESKYPEYQLCVKGPIHKVWRDGFPVDEAKILVLEFDRFICEVDVMNSNQEWNEPERESVVRALERHFNDPSFRDVWVHEAPKPSMPWPTYNETHHNQIAIIAKATGQIEAALAYESRGREGGPRDSVVKKLQELAAEIEDDSSDTGAEVEEIFAV